MIRSRCVCSHYKWICNYSLSSINYCYRVAYTLLSYVDIVCSRLFLEDSLLLLVRGCLLIRILSNDGVRLPWKILFPISSTDILLLRGNQWNILLSNPLRFRFCNRWVVLLWTHSLSLWNLSTTVIFVTAPLLLTHTEILLLLDFLLLLLIESWMECSCRGWFLPAIWSTKRLRQTNKSCIWGDYSYATWSSIIYVINVYGCSTICEDCGTLGWKWSALYTSTQIDRKRILILRSCHLFVAWNLVHLFDDKVLLFHRIISSFFLIRRSSKAITGRSCTFRCSSLKFIIINSRPFMMLRIYSNKNSIDEEY